MSAEKKAIYSMQRNKGRTLRVLNTHQRQTHNKHIQFLEKQKLRSRKMIDLECEGYYDQLEHHLTNVYPNTPKCLLDDIRSRNALQSKEDEVNNNFKPLVPKEPTKYSNSRQLRFGEESFFSTRNTSFNRSKTDLECHDKAVRYEETRPSSKRSNFIPVLEQTSLSSISQSMGDFSDAGKQRHNQQSPPTVNTFNKEDKLRRNSSDTEMRSHQNYQIPLNPSTCSLPSQRKNLLLRFKTSLPQNFKTRKSANLSGIRNRSVRESSAEMLVSDTAADTDEIVRSSLNRPNIEKGSDLEAPIQKDRHNYSHLMYTSISCLPPVHTNEQRHLVMRSWSPPPRTKAPNDNMDEFKQLRFCRYLRK